MDNRICGGAGIEMEKNNTHLAGEYFVAAELYKRGFSVGMTIGNAKSVDIFISKNDELFPVQVKAIKDKKSVGWPMMKDTIKEDIIYVFVNLKGESENPDYYILTGKEAKGKVKQYSTRGILDLSSLKDGIHKNRWDKLTKLNLIK